MPAPSPAPRPRRRTLLARTALLGGGLLLAGCDRVRIGQPATYTPPPPGIDDLYRLDILDLIDQGLASTASGDGAVADLLSRIDAALGAQRAALLTGAETEQEANGDATSAASDGGGAVSGDDAGAVGPADTQALSDLLVSIRTLCTQASRQISGSLVRTVLATGVFAAWAAARLHRLGAADAPEDVPDPDDIEPTREVPSSDPPSIAAPVDHEAVLADVQEDEWYAGYAYEVLAASADDEKRERLLTWSDECRERAEALARVAEDEGYDPVLRRAVYPLPGGTLTPELIVQLPEDLATALLSDHVVLAASAPFDQRPLPIATALVQGVRLASITDALDPLTSVITPPN